MQSAKLVLDAIKHHPHYTGFRNSDIGVAVRRIARYRPTFKGRATRTEFVKTLIVFVLIAIALRYLINHSSTLASALFMADTAVGKVISNGIWILIYLPLWAALVRRLHDTNRRWWAVFVTIMPYVGWAILIAMLFLWKGDEGENAFGPNPRQMQ